MYGFELGREFKLSLAEIFSFFTEYYLLYVDEKILVLDRIKKEDIERFSKRNGGTIKIFEIEKKLKKDTSLSEISSFLIGEIKNLAGGKKEFGINFFGEKKYDAKRFLLDIKKSLKEKNISSRFVNKDFKNLSSAQIIGGKLVEKGSDINIISGKHELYIGKSIWVQDIESYSKRDFGKKRDMHIGMLPPKLAQIMINIGTGKKEKIRIYDPFCGLGTTLIESVLMGNKEVFGSDINEEMIETTKENLEFTKENFTLKEVKYTIQKLDARSIQTADILKFGKVDVIISEGYLGEIFTHQNISAEKIQAERKKLQELYHDFFTGIKRVRFTGVIVMSFPFWELKRKYIYFEEIYAIIKSFCRVEKMIAENHFARETKVGSLLYKRSNQLVGREIFKLRVK